MNWTKIKNIGANAIGALTYTLFPLAGHPNINYAVTDADEFTLGFMSLVSYGISDLTKNRTLVSEAFSGIGSGGFGLLAYNISYNLTKQLISSTRQ